MYEIFFTDDAYGKLNEILRERLNGPYKILRTENGKPYIEGDPLFFSISHSKGKSAVVINDRPVGADIEVFADRKYGCVLSRFCTEERAEISCLTDFLRHWVVREAYVKMTGATLAGKLYKLKYFGDTLYDDGKPVDCEIINLTYEDCVACICIDNKGAVC